MKTQHSQSINLKKIFLSILFTLQLSPSNWILFKNWEKSYESGFVVVVVLIFFYFSFLIKGSFWLGPRFVFWEENEMLKNQRTFENCWEGYACWILKYLTPISKYCKTHVKQNGWRFALFEGLYMSYNLILTIAIQNQLYYYHPPNVIHEEMETETLK